MSRALTRVQLKEVVGIITKLFPPQYADNAWDNTGLHIDCSNDESKNEQCKVLLTVDLTSSVAEEAIRNNCNLILSYHPFIFPSWKNITPYSNTQHGNAIKLIQKGISVYCPHTAVDAVNGGVNDWLVNSIVDDREELIGSNVAIERVSNVEDNETIGYGRLVKLEKSLPLNEVIVSLKKNLGIEHLQIASLTSDYKSIKISNVALCAGSGSGVFRSLKNVQEIDLFLTGELSHHEILKFKEMGKVVIVCNHTNTERGYVRKGMLKALKTATESIGNKNIQYIVSETDEDPLKTI
ncbi:hypothetical protein TPHA_0D03500 [Tetrapisispora phaffii CBS 4417]|uniref:YbgI/family dinuclear metal center protein n=1 Tax=Tetrapisispora phaffii (strain ATCC 24235 / CBS 4417 / NBRC 1672 / NRRL Y-8282 / UCD 70-5) TaxID=1071381 RepID=G8BT14_TETPH|nr:hypothetical protein TPHA_0D03500 [Tetrapisispora phaffii CBS 4417]CCE62985.1 hypothetical protein TPHA_0D03500 [Tetrapisispora phaffii CBS 4417]